MPKTPSEVKCQRVVCFPRRNGDIYNSFSIDAIARYGELEQVALPASLNADTFVDPNPKLQDSTIKLAVSEFPSSMTSPQAMMLLKWLPQYYNHDHWFSSSRT